MLKKIPIRLRLTILSVLLLTLCCVGLTAILNISANQMANVIEAVQLTPAYEAGHGSDPTYGVPAAPTTIVELSEASQTARAGFFQQSIFYMLGVVAVGGALTYYISGKALKPLQELSSQMKNRTVHNLSETLPDPQSHDEMAELTRSFNEMSAKLDETFAMQKRFSQSAAHELRTPLTVIKTKIDVFKKKKEHTPAEYDEVLSVISTYTNRLSNLVKDLLNLTGIDSLDCDETVLAKEIIAEIMEELSPLMTEKNVTATVSGEDLALTGNRNLLHRAFFNLVENAVKYNSANGTIDIELSRREALNVITIKDSGIGIPKDARELVFEPFFRVDKSRSRQIGGAGLGLSTTQAIIEKHGGKVVIHENPSGGTVFEIKL